MREILGVCPTEVKTCPSKTCPSLAAQWLTLHAPGAREAGLIPGQGTKIPHARHGQKLLNRTTTKKTQNLVHECSEQLYSQWPKSENNPNVHRQGMREQNVYVYTHSRMLFGRKEEWSLINATVRIHIEDSILRESRHRRPRFIIPSTWNVQNRQIHGDRK